MYNDPGPVALTQHDELDDPMLREIVSTTKRCVRTVLFDDIHSSIYVCKMEDGVLYRSMRHNMELVEWWMARHDMMISLGHQVSMSKMADHVFSTSTVDNVLEGLNMLEGPGRAYTLLLIGVNDCSLESPTGMVFAHKVPANSPLVKFVIEKETKAVVEDAVREETTEKEEKGKEKIIKLGLKKWQEYLDSGLPDTWKNADRVRTVMARVRVFGLPSFVLPRDRKPKGKLQQATHQEESASKPVSKEGKRGRGRPRKVVGN